MCFERDRELFYCPQHLPAFANVFLAFAYVCPLNTLTLAVITFIRVHTTTCACGLIGFSHSYFFP